MKLSLALSWSAFVVISELLIGFTYSIILGCSLSNIVLNDVSKLAGSIMSTLILLIIIKVLQVYKGKKENLESFSFLDSLKVGIIPLSSILIMHTLKSLTENTISDVQYFVFISLLCIVCINLFFCYLLDQLKRTEKIKFENELLKRQSEYFIELEKQLNLIFDKIRTVNHDLNHHLMFIKSKLEDNSTDSLKEIETKINLLLCEISSGDIKTYTKHQKLNRLLNYKLFRARKSEITTDVKISIREDCFIDEDCLYIILGNAIDNALDAIMQFNCCELVNKKLSINIIDDNNNLYIKIENPYSGQLTFKNGLPVTTKKNSSVHGIGLMSIKKLVDDRDGYFKISLDNNVFSLQILLYDEILN